MDFTRALLEIHESISEHITFQKHRVLILKRHKGDYLMDVSDHDHRVVISKKLSSEVDDIMKGLYSLESLSGFFYREIVAHASNRDFEEALFTKTGAVPVIILNMLKKYEELCDRLDALSEKFTHHKPDSNVFAVSGLSGLIQGILNKA